MSATTSVRMSGIGPSEARFYVPPVDPSLAPPTDIDVPFEGVEKRLVVHLKPGLPYRPYDFSKTEWQSILDYAHCEIVSERHLGDTSVYLLSESTLTVWPSGFLLKTCGRTTPFLVLDVLGKYVYPDQPLVDIIDWMLYSRLDFLHPQFQVWPHQSHTQETDYLSALIPGTVPFNLPAGKHALVGFVYSPTVPIADDIDLEEALMMQIDRHCVRTFSGFDTPDEQKNHDDKSDYHGFLRPTLTNNAAASELDEFWFSPFGYSSNALATSTRQPTTQQDDEERLATYFSCHVSPEPETSYASLEVGGHRSETRNNCAKLIPIANLVPAFNAKFVHITKVSVSKTTVRDLESQLHTLTKMLKSSRYHLRESSSVTVGYLAIHHVLMEERPGVNNFLSLADLPDMSFAASAPKKHDQITNALTTASGDPTSGDDLSDKVNSQD